jgi:peroxiredoxin
LRSFQDNLPEFNARRIRVVAISVDPPGVSQHLRETAHYSFLFLSDDKAQVIHQWDLTHPKAGIDGVDIARPAEYLLDASGKIRWMKLTDDYLIRARPEEVLQVSDAMNLSGN